MIITHDAPLFRPVTIRLEDQDDYDQLCMIIQAVAENRVNHIPQLIKAAKAMHKELIDAENKDD